MAGLAEDDVEQDARLIWIKRGGIVVLLLIVVGGFVQVARDLTAPVKSQQRQVAKIRIVPDTPPPPPPPKEERRPESPKDVKEVKVEQPKEQPPAPSEQLKMEGEGSDKGLAGLVAGTVSKDYVGQPTAGAGNRFAWYGDLLLQEVKQLLAKNSKLRVGEYRVVVSVWVAPDGRVSRAELAGSSGNSDIDALLRASLAEIPPLRERPPEGLPWPIRLRVTSRL